MASLSIAVGVEGHDEIQRIADSLLEVTPTLVVVAEESA